MTRSKMEIALRGKLWADYNESLRLGFPRGSGPRSYPGMLEQRGAVGTAIALITSAKESSGFTWLWENLHPRPTGLRLSLEAAVVEGWGTWGALFSEVPDLRQRAERRLQKYGVVRRAAIASLE